MPATPPLRKLNLILLMPFSFKWTGRPVRTRIRSSNGPRAFGRISHLWHLPWASNPDHAIGASTYKLKFGHRGANQPVRNQETEKVSITSQNHGFAAEKEALEACGAIVTEYNLNDQTVSGMRLSDKPVFSVQYHPEAAPGPNDAQHLFQTFHQLVSEAKAVV